jgi:hypothetical protein
VQAVLAFCDLFNRLKQAREPPGCRSLPSPSPLPLPLHVRATTGSRTSSHIFAMLYSGQQRGIETDRQSHSNDGIQYHQTLKWQTGHEAVVSLEHGYNLLCCCASILRGL